jgi:hypothetical protein
MKTILCLWIWVLTAAALWLPLPAAQATVVVYGEASSTGELVSVRLLADITSTPLLSFSLRLLYDSAALAVNEATKNESVWYLSDGKTRYPYLDPDLSIPGQILIIGGRMDGLDQIRGIIGKQVLLGSAVFRRLNSTTPRFKLNLGRASPFANFASPEGKALELISGEVTLGEISPNLEDMDLDGLNDRWEQRYFGEIGFAFYSDDPDHDGATNLQEQALGTDPTVPDAGFRLSVFLKPEGLWIEWPSQSNRVYTIESTSVLPVFAPLVKDLVATPPTNKYLQAIDELHDLRFYRVLSLAAPR